jgi:DNA-binding NarL/FixJ family response regulator
LDSITVIIVDDHPIFRQGVADSFSLVSDIDVVAQAESGEEGLEKIRALHPDVAILDINLPGINGLQVARQITNEKIHTRIILLTAYADVHQKIQGLQQGAAAFCTKDILPDSLANIIRLVAAGKFWIDNQVYEAGQIRNILDGQVVGSKSEISELGKLAEPLSIREMEILTYITRGMSNKEIASLLGISHQTVKNHVTAILHKLGVSDRTQAALSALQHGWVRLSE